MRWPYEDEWIEIIWGTVLGLLIVGLIFVAVFAIRGYVTDTQDQLSALQTQVAQDGARPK